jgi:hypothetical protein
MGEQRDTAISDPRALRAIAHPVRFRILDEFAARGGLRAADVARILDIPANQASFHLRQLAKYGLLTEAPEEARDARDRVWRLEHASLSVNTDDLNGTAAGRVAADLFKRKWADRVHGVLEELMQVDEESAEHVYRGGTTSLLLTDDEARALFDEMSELLDRHRARGQGSTDPDAVTYQVVVLAHPQDIEVSSKDGA